LQLPVWRELQAGKLFQKFGNWGELQEIPLQAKIKQTLTILPATYFMLACLALAT